MNVLLPWMLLKTPRSRVVVPLSTALRVLKWLKSSVRGYSTNSWLEWTAFHYYLSGRSSPSRMKHYRLRRLLSLLLLLLFNSTRSTNGMSRVLRQWIRYSTLPAVQALSCNINLSRYLLIKDSSYSFMNTEFQTVFIWNMNDQLTSETVSIGSSHPLDDVNVSSSLFMSSSSRNLQLIIQIS